jgi:N-acetylmuramoyl-L-alanine amidase
LFFTCIIRVSLSDKPVPNKNYTIKKVVIDPGHGGNDSGCLGSSCQEKNIALAISLKFGRLIEENFKDIKVIYTRTTDKFVDLGERAEISNRENADLFICIHCNSSPGGNAYGIETYAMGISKSDANLNVAKRENASILLEDNYEKNYNGFNPNSPESNIVFSLYQNAFLDQSLSLAAKIQREVGLSGRYDRGVKQERFLVLWRTTMPSILVETGFLTNPTEEAFMKTEDGQNIIATAIFKGFKSYKAEVENGTGVKGPKVNKEPNEVVNPPQKEVPHDVKPKKDSVKIVKQDIKPATDTIVQKKEYINIPKDTIAPKAVKVNVAPVTDNDTYFTVQIAILPNATPVTSPKFNGVEGVRMENWGNNTFKYLAGKEKDFNKITIIQNQLRTKGFPDAFVVAYSNGKRITVREALLILDKKN